MIVSLDDYYEAFPSSTYDAEDIEAGIRRIQTRIESYLDRRLESQAYTETHRYVSGKPIVLKQYPVSELASVTKDGMSIAFDTMVLNTDTGVLFHNNLLTWAKTVVVGYTAGYVTCPDDIKSVLFDLLAAYLGGTLDSAGPQEARALKKETVYGVSSVEYFAASAVSKVEFFPELGPYVSVLERYKRPYEVPVL